MCERERKYGGAILRCQIAEEEKLGDAESYFVSTVRQVLSCDEQQARPVAFTSHEVTQNVL